MRKIILVVIGVFLYGSGFFAQVGLSVGYKQMQATGWDNLIANYNLTVEEDLSPLKEGTSFALDYWFRLKNYRIEFLPELSFSRYTRDWVIEPDPESNIYLRSNHYSFSFHTNFYFLDFKGDCNCPTFSKDGDIISKGFFLQVSPAVAYINNSFERSNSKTTTGDLSFGAGIGAGLDIGISRFITFTPMVRYSYFLGANWDDLHILLSNDEIPDPSLEENNTSDLSQFFIGLRIGFRFDELNKYGYR